MEGACGMPKSQVRSRPGYALARLRTGHPPDEVARELVAGGVPPAEACRIVNGAIQTRYQEHRARAQRSMMFGGVIFVLSGGLSAATLISWNAGGIGVLFYGGVLAGVAEFARGWRARPTPPRYLKSGDTERAQ